VPSAKEKEVESASPSGCPYATGQKVSHRLFGEGTVMGMEKSLDGWRLEIRFPVVGSKKLMHTYVNPVGEPRISKEDVFD
jgi:hypothetical protein